MSPGSGGQSCTGARPETPGVSFQSVSRVCGRLPFTIKDLIRRFVRSSKESEEVRVSAGLCLLLTLATPLVSILVTRCF